jgi:hypothetical protein
VRLGSIRNRPLFGPTYSSERTSGATRQTKPPSDYHPIRKHRTKWGKGTPLKDKTFIFLAGLHRSGTSLLHEIIREHPEVSGFSGTGVPEDEGQHLQTVYPPAKVFGGPGKFAFDERSHMDESHPLASDECAHAIYEQWAQHYDLSRKYLIEKSPPNLIRARYLQRLFPGCKFVVILRHPIAVSYATQKWSKSSIESLIEHSLRAYEIFLKDMEHLDPVHVLRYEEFVCAPQKTIDTVYEFLGLNPVTIRHEVRKDVNAKYFSMWQKDRKSLYRRLLSPISPTTERRANKCGYSIKKYGDLVAASWLGSHHKATSPAG